MKEKKDNDAVPEDEIEMDSGEILKSIEVYEKIILKLVDAELLTPAERKLVEHIKQKWIENAHFYVLLDENNKIIKHAETIRDAETFQKNLEMCGTKCTIVPAKYKKRKGE